MCKDSFPAITFDGKEAATFFWAAAFSKWLQVRAVTTCKNWHVGSANPQMQHVSSAEL